MSYCEAFAKSDWCRRSEMRSFRAMSTKSPKPEERLRQMQAMFAKDRAILAEDYAHFTGISPQDAAIRRSKAPRKSAEPSAQQDPRRS